MRVKKRPIYTLQVLSAGLWNDRYGKQIGKMPVLRIELFQGTITRKLKGTV